MKKVIILLFIGLLFSCEKPEEPEIDLNKGTVVFWTTENSLWTLYVDDIKIGKILQPYLVNTTDLIPNCDNKQFTKLVLLKGKHYYKISILPTPSQPDYLSGETYSFDIIGGGCTVVRVTQ